MDYEKFLKDYNTYNEFNKIIKNEVARERELEIDNNKEMKSTESSYPGYPPQLSLVPEDTISFDFPKFNEDDRVNSPSHYKGGKQEVIDIIEDAIKDAPNVTAGMLQAQVLKYMLRCWLKDNPVEDLKKAQWYLDRLIKQQS